MGSRHDGARVGEGTHMDGSRFDEVARRWAVDSATRRATLRLALGALLSAALARPSRGAAACGLVGSSCASRDDTACCPGSVCRQTPNGTFACRCRYRRTECGGKCWVLAVSETHCGQCGNPCAAGQRCCDGACHDACPGGQAFDEAICGCRCDGGGPFCGGACCGADQTCCGGACYDACPAGKTRDGTTCACVADVTCLANGARCGRARDAACCSGRCVRQRGSRKRFCRRRAAG